MYFVFMLLIRNERKLSSVNNLHAIPGKAEIIQKIDSTTLCAFQKYKFCLLSANKYRQNDSTFSLAEKFTLFLQNLTFKVGIFPE